ncbi:MAG TPA: ABC transporter ATP-binding protein [Acidimicrobiia bacterium]|nr:ABC transporter ATP-binding protein [Acidimicrobiia bacterium]
MTVAQSHAQPQPNTEPLLKVEGLCGGYGPLQVLFGVDIEIRAGEVVAVLGPNGAGKSTLLRTLAGRLRPSAGTVHFDGEPVGGWPPERIVERGLVHVAEGRRVFPGLTVDENLRLGTHTRRLRRSELADEIARVGDLFPRLAERSEQPAGRLSGGEQQMLVIARALLARPRVLMVDEASLGLAPNIVQFLFDTLGRLAAAGLTVLLVEQYVGLALKLAGRGYVLQRGRVALTGTSAQLGQAGVVEASYLGDESARAELAHGGNR